MSSRDRISRDPVLRIQSEDEMAGGLAAFIPEAAIGGTSFKPEPKHPLWEFPEEAALAAALANRVASRRSSTYASYASLVAAILIAAAAGAWWGRLIPGSRPVATAASLPPVVMAPVVKPPDDPLSHPPAQLFASLEVRSSTQPPVATIVQTPIPVALVGAAPEQRQPPERAMSMARGTSGGALAASISMPRLESRPPTEPTPTAPIVAANPALRSPAPEPTSVFEASPATSLPASRVPAPVVRPEPEAFPSVVARSEQSEIQRTLGLYRSAYQRLDAEAARAVWPSVDVRALTRAFETLTSQQLAFETCQFDIVGEAATAQCRGSASYTPKVGSRGPKLEPRQWTFQLRKVDDGWKIQTAQTTR